MDNRYISNLAFIDLLFNLMLGFVMLFLISFLLINTPEKTADIEQKAEILVILSWDDMHTADMDLWVESPSGIVSYVSPNRGSLHLDKDDLGTRNDTFTTADGVIKFVRINREIVSLRALESGKYTVNAHLYSHGNIGAHPNSISGDANVTVEVLRLNPFRIIHNSSKVFSAHGQEETFVRFKITPTGLVENINYLPKNLVRKHGP